MNTLNEQNNLIKTLKDLGLNGMAEAATNQFNNEFSYSALNFCQRLQELLEREDSYRKKMKYQRIIRQGKLKYQLTFNDIHFGDADGLKKDDLKYLISNHWALVSPVNIYIQGKTGVGKTAMACTLLNNLALEGYTVRFWRMCDLQNEVERLSNDPGKLKSFTTKLAKYDVLAIDDLGLNSEVMPAKIVSFIFNVIDARSPRKSTVITSQMKPDGLLRVFGSGAQAEAIVDRLLRPCKIISLKGESKRTTI